MKLDVNASYAHSGSAALDGRNIFEGNSAGGGFKMPQWGYLGALGVTLLLGVAWILRR